MKPIRVEAAHNLHAFLNRLLTQCAIEKRAYKGVYEIPYPVIMGPNKAYQNSKIKMVVDLFWDGDLDDGNTEPEYSRRSNQN